MADLQKYFYVFHDNIKLVLSDEQELRDKRDEIIEQLKENLKQETELNFETFNQGSYAMKTGIKALDKGDYDIDVGILFSLQEKEDEDPIEMKNTVFNALQEFEDVKIKIPCVTVKFENENENSPNYHVDFAIYAKDDLENYYIAKGKSQSLAENKLWEECDPKELIKIIKEVFNSQDERRQFRRIIRYLKRWKDLKFKGQVNRPTGIGLTIAAVEKFEPCYTEDNVSFNKKFNDLKALRIFVDKMIQDFQSVCENDESGVRLKVILPTKPFNDIYSKVTLNQMKDFKSKLENLRDNLIEAEKLVDTREACELIMSELGEDFPVPTEDETAEVMQKAILSNTSSAKDEFSSETRF